MAPNIFINFQYFYVDYNKDNLSGIIITKDNNELEEFKMTDIKLPGGRLTLEKLTAIFQTIPVEFDFIDQDDIIRWSSMNQHRLFKRTEADLGKHVLEVHPGHAKQRVQTVLDQMHSGKRQSISLLITYHHHPVNIAFYALHDTTGGYLGCVEVTQDVSQAQQKRAWFHNLKQIFSH